MSAITCELIKKVRFPDSCWISRRILRAWAGRARVRVNSYHHQAVKKIGRTLKVAARAKDGIVEALEGRGSPFVLGVQFHPERMFRRDSFSRKIFKKFIGGAAGKV